MLPIQEINIKTKNNRVFSVHLEKWSETVFECKVAVINLGPQLIANAMFSPFTKADTAKSAYTSLITGLNSSLANIDATDFIVLVENPYNTELVNVDLQKEILGTEVIIKVNGNII
jgi:hypothetical protein